MICVECTVAGECNQLANQLSDGIVKRGLIRQAERRHAACPGDDQCNCQHVIGNVINTEGNN